MAQVDNGGGGTTDGSDGGADADQSPRGFLTTGTIDGEEVQINIWKALLLSAPPAVAGFLLWLATAGDQAIQTLVAFASNPLGFIRAAITQLVFRDFLLPLAAALFNGLVAVLAFFGRLTFGSDFAIGIAPGSAIGLLDIPFTFTGPIATAVTGTFRGVVDAIHGVFQGLGSLEPLGLAAPTVVTGLWTLTFALGAWGAWILLSTIDLPFIDVKGFLLSVSRPFRNLLGGFR